MRPARLRPGAVVVVTFALAWAIAADTPGALAASPDAEAIAAGDRFLDRYVSADGRVVRLDQGGDTVSEGQAYGMLIAAALGDHERFDRVWMWTRTNLQRDDGLLAWHWHGGEVTDHEPATDADLAAASALAVAGERWSNNGYLVDARRIATAVAAHETVATSSGAALVAGPWAVPQRVVNPSYLMPIDLTRLEWLSGGDSWSAAATTARAIVADLTAAPPRLPPDWATVADSPTDASPSPSPGGASPRYGFEAVRVLVTFAADCNKQGQQIAAQAWPFFLGELDAGRRIVAVYDLTGRPLADYEHPSGLAAAAAAADAAGADDAAAGLLARAEQLDGDHPTYYGAAWIALARLWLDTDRLGGCHP